jgi:hypothetical protein
VGPVPGGRGCGELTIRGRKISVFCTPSCRVPGGRKKTDSGPDFRLTRSRHPRASASGRRIGSSAGDGWAARRDPETNMRVFFWGGCMWQLQVASVDDCDYPVNLLVPSCTVEVLCKDLGTRPCHKEKIELGVAKVNYPITISLTEEPKINLSFRARGPPDIYAGWSTYKKVPR